VRRLPRQWSVDSTISFENTFARQVARAYCRARHDTACDRRDDAEEVFLPFDNEDLWKNHYAVGDLFRCTFDESRVCSDWFEEKGKGIAKITDWENTIVILGAHFPDMNDWHRTPIDERTPGLLVNASAVRAEISGPRLQGFSHLAGFGLDLLLGGIAAVLVDFLKGRGYRLRSRTLACIGLGVAAVGFGYLLFLLTEMLWVSWVGMLMTGVSWDAVLEVLFHDPHDRDSSPTPPVTAPA
jgi:hypothetical protein